MSFEAVMPPYNASDPSARFLSSSCLDFLLIELVPMAYRVTHEVDAAAATGAGVVPEVAVAGGEGGTAGNRASIISGTATAMDEDEERDAVFFRLERLGYRVGQGLVERLVFFFPFPPCSGLGRGGGLVYGHANTHPDSPATAHASTTRST